MGIREILVAKFKASLLLGKIPENCIETMLKEAEAEIKEYYLQEIEKCKIKGDSPQSEIWDKAIDFIVNKLKGE